MSPMLALHLDLSTENQHANYFGNVSKQPSRLISSQDRFQSLGLTEAEDEHRVDSRPF